MKTNFRFASPYAPTAFNSPRGNTPGLDSGQTLSVPGGLGSHISWLSIYGDGKVVSHTHRPPLLPGNTPDIHFC